MMSPQIPIRQSTFTDTQLILSIPVINKPTELSIFAQSSLITLCLSASRFQGFIRLLSCRPKHVEARTIQGEPFSHNPTASPFMHFLVIKIRNSIGFFNR